MKNFLLHITLLLCLSTATAHDYTGNPILPGYYADPSIVIYEGKFYIFATIDPWGSGQLALWETEDFVNWKFHELNWPTKELCQTSQSSGAMVWAPGVIRAKNGKFYMYVSVGSEIYVGVADKPIGPWKNAFETGQPLVPSQEAIGVHSIDAEPFIDDNGQAYLYWGSGYQWKNGHCLVAKLNPDMISFNGDFKDITPPNYFEAPYMLKYENTYHLMYSQGKCTDTSYKVRSVVFDAPMGKAQEETEQKILFSHVSNGVIGPGHHTVLKISNKYYILYHRINPSLSGELYRQICMDQLTFNEKGEMLPVTPSNLGIPYFVPITFDKDKNVAGGKLILVSSIASPATSPGSMVDHNYGTLWKAASNDSLPEIIVDLRETRQISSVHFEFEYAHKAYHYKIEHSLDNEHWALYTDKTKTNEHGSPIIVNEQATARYVRITFFNENSTFESPGIFELGIYE